jgi:hypothetical protein
MGETTWALLIAGVLIVLLFSAVIAAAAIWQHIEDTMAQTSDPWGGYVEYVQVQDPEQAEIEAPKEES